MSKTNQDTYDGWGHTEGCMVATGCTVTEPSRLVQRRLKGTEWVGTYCTTHDPLNREDVADMWEYAELTEHSDED